MALYMLGTLNDRGEEVFQGVFDSEEELFKAIPERPKLRLVGNQIVADAVDGLGKYRVREIVPNQKVPGTGEIDLPDICVTVESETSTGTTYGVAIREGKIVACTCPSFQYAKSDDGCKHMQRVYERPYLFGLGSRPIYYTRDGALPGEFFRQNLGR